MKKIYVLIILLVIVFAGHGQVRQWTGGSGSWTDPARWTPAGIPVQGETIVFKDISATVSNVPQLTVSGLVAIESNVILNTAIPGTSLIIEDLNASSGFEVESGSSVTLGQNIRLTIALHTSANVDGALIVNAGSIFDSENASKTIISGLIRNSGEIRSSKEILLFKKGSIYEHTSDKGKIPTASWDREATCVIKGVTTSAPGGLDQVFGNYIWDCIHQNNSQSSPVQIPTEIRGNLIIKKAGNGSSSITVWLPELLNIGGNFEIESGQCTGKSANLRIDLSGDLVIRGGSLKANSSLPGSSSAIRFAGTQRQVFNQTGGTFHGLKIFVADKACLDLGESVIAGDGDFVIEAGARLMVGHPEGIAASGTAGAIQVTGKRLFSDDAEYVYSGKSAQETGNGLPEKVRSLVIDNQSGIQFGHGVKLSRATMVQGQLLLMNGYLITSAEQMLTLGENAQASGSDQSFVSGPMRKKGDGSFVFPTGWAGNGGGRVPIGMKLIGDAAEIQAEYKRAPATEKGKTINAPLHHINYCEYWELFPTAGSARAVVTMYYNAHSNCSPVSLINDFSSARVARSDGKAWSQIGNADDSLNDGNGYVISDYAGTIISREERFFALGNITNATDPLPVMFDNVTAYEKNDGVAVEWSNLTERDIAIYYVERSSNGMDYTIIGQYLPTSNRDDKATYSSFDPDPLPGTNFYRIKVIEKSTKIIFSKVMRVETGVAGQYLRLYPNPVVNRQVMIGMMGMQEGKYEIRIINAMGRQVSRSVITVKGHASTQTLALPATMHPGVYSMVIDGSNYRDSKMFIVQ